MGGAKLLLVDTVIDVDNGVVDVDNGGGNSTGTIDTSLLSSKTKESSALEGSDRSVGLA